MLSLFTLRSLLQLSKRTYEFRLTGSSTPGRTASRSQPQLADLVAERFGRAGPTRLQIMSSGQTTRPRATGSRSTSIMPHGSRFGQSRSSPRSGSPPAPPGFGPARRHLARLARPVSIAFRPRSLTRPLVCSRSSSSTKELATYKSLLGLRARSSPNRQKPAATTGWSAGIESLRRLARRPLSVYCEIEGHDRG
jgi:hypothetical protein